MRALANRGQTCTLEPMRHLKASLPFVLPEMDSNNWVVEFINHGLGEVFGGGDPQPVLLT